LQALGLDAAQGAAQLLDFAFVGDFLAFSHFDQLQNAFDVVHHLLEVGGNLGGVLDGLGNGGRIGLAEIGGFDPRLGALLLTGFRARFRPRFGTRLRTFGAFLTFPALGPFGARIAAHFLPVFGAERRFRALAGFPGGVLTFGVFGRFRGPVVFMVLMVFMGLVGFTRGVGGFVGVVEVAGLAGFFGMRFAEAAGVIRFDRVNAVSFRRADSPFGGVLDGVGHGRKGFIRICASGGSGGR
jgi:hypothetical protein